jgi:hypothetical protein
MTTLGKENHENQAEADDPFPKDGPRKRRREEEQEWKKAVKRKLKEEEGRVNSEEENSYQINSEMYALFNDLQGISKE